MIKQHTIYLAGPITGCTYATGQDWRRYCVKRFRENNIHAINPLRYTKHLREVNGTVPATFLNTSHPFTTHKGITTRDRADLMSCDLVFMNLLESKRISVGTMIEAGWADALRKPIVLVMEDGNMHTHGMLLDIAGFVANSLEEAITLAIGVLPGADPEDL